jgi:translation initiation factor 3 subunit B
MNGVLEFVDTADFTSMGGGEHFMCTDVEWDPTGRYVMTGVSWWGHKVDNAYWLWNFQGKILKRSSVEKFCQLVWRPRPPTLLVKEQIKEIKKNLKKYSVKFNQKDAQRSNKASAELAARRQKLMSSFSEWKEQKEEEYAMARDKRMALRDGIDTDYDEGDQFEEETVEFLIKEEETIIQD